MTSLKCMLCELVRGFARKIVLTGKPYLIELYFNNLELSPLTMDLDNFHTTKYRKLVVVVDRIQDLPRQLMARAEQFSGGESVVVVTAHGMESGYIRGVRNEKVPLDKLVDLLAMTGCCNIIILAVCYGGSIVSKYKGYSGKRIVYSKRVIKDSDAVRDVRLILGNLEFWQLEESVRIVNIARGADVWGIRVL